MSVDTGQLYTLLLPITFESRIVRTLTTHPKNQTDQVQELVATKIVSISTLCARTVETFHIKLDLIVNQL